MKYTNAEIKGMFFEPFNNLLSQNKDVKAHKLFTKQIIAILESSLSCVYTDLMRPNIYCIKFERLFDSSKNITQIDLISTDSHRLLRIEIKDKDFIEFFDGLLKFIDNEKNVFNKTNRSSDRISRIKQEERGEYKIESVSINIDFIKFILDIIKEKCSFRVEKISNENYSIDLEFPKWNAVYSEPSNLQHSVEGIDLENVVTKEEKPSIKLKKQNETEYELQITKYEAEQERLKTLDTPVFQKRFIDNLQKIEAKLLKLFVSSEKGKFYYNQKDKPAFYIQNLNKIVVSSVMMSYRV